MEIVEEEPTVCVPVSILTDILEKVKIVADAVKLFPDALDKLSTQITKFEGLQGARDKEYTDKFAVLIKAVAGVSGTFTPIKTLEDLDKYEVKLTDSTIEVEILVIYNIL